MKKVFFSIAAVAIIGLGVATTIYSCSNDEDGTTNGKRSKITYAGVPISTFSYTNHNGECVKMLEFENFDGYWETKKVLSESVSEHNDNFFAEYGRTHTITDSTVLWLDSLDFNYQQPLADFENSLGFNTSMRKEFNDYESKWLESCAGKDLDMSKSPSTVFPVGEVERSLVNKDGAVKCGDTIFRFTMNGYIAITDGDIATLNAFNNGNMGVLTQANVINKITEPTPGVISCVKDKDKTYPHDMISEPWMVVTTEYKVRINAEIRIWYRPWYVVIGSFSTSQAESHLYGQLIRNGNALTWGMVATGQRIEIYQTLLNNMCNPAFPLGHSSDSKAKDMVHFIGISTSKWFVWGHILNGESVYAKLKVQKFPQITQPLVW